MLIGAASFYAEPPDEASRRLAAALPPRRLRDRGPAARGGADRPGFVGADPARAYVGDREDPGLGRVRGTRPGDGGGGEDDRLSRPAIPVARAGAGWAGRALDADRAPGPHPARQKRQSGVRDKRA